MKRRPKDEDEFDNEEAVPDFIVRQSSSGVATFLLGLAIGAGLAMLLTPRSGTELRQSFRNAIARKRGRVRQAVEEGKAAASEARDDLKQRIAEKKAAYRS
jgi:gas vesicle protein